MKTMLRKSENRGTSDLGWLKAKFSFSFSNYHDPDYMGFSDLRVINEDRIEAGKGFGTHPHKDMEILTYVLDGAVAHKDSIGNEAVVKPGEVQTMSAGTGIFHSEFNPNPDKETHLLQIWIETEAKNLDPSYGEYRYQEDVENNKLNHIAGKTGPAKIHQDVEIYLGKLDSDKALSFEKSGRSFWVQVTKGSIKVNDQELTTGDGLGIAEVEKLDFQALSEENEFLFFDLRPV